MKILSGLTNRTYENFIYSDITGVPSSGFSLYTDNFNRAIFGTSGRFMSFFDFNNQSSNRIYTFPDESGTLLLTTGPIGSNQLLYTNSGTISSLPLQTSGQVSFYNSNGLPTGSNNLFWDNTQLRIGILQNTNLRSPLTIFGDRRNDIVVTGNTTITSNVITNLSSTTGIIVGMQLIGSGIPSDNYVVSIDSATQITMTRAASSTNIATTITFNNYIQASSDLISYIPTSYTGLNNVIRFRTASISSGLPNYPQNLNVLGGIAAFGWDNVVNDWNSSSLTSIQFIAASAHTSTSKATRMGVFVTPSGSISSTESWRFRDNGDFQSRTFGANYGTTTSDRGFIYLQTVPGTPTGVPDGSPTVSSRAVVLDSLNKRIWANSGSGWEIFGDGSLSTTAFVQGGNSYGANARIGTNDTFRLEFETDNVQRAFFYNNSHGFYIGDVGVGGSGFLTLAENKNDNHSLHIVNPNTGPNAVSFLQLETGGSGNYHTLSSFSPSTAYTIFGISAANNMELYSDGKLFINSFGGVHMGDGAVSSITLLNGNVSIGKNSAGNTSLDIFGDLSISRVLETAHGTTYNSLNTTGYSYIKIGTGTFPSGSGTTVIDGMSGGFDGKVVWIYNNSSSNIAISNESVSASAANRFDTNLGVTNIIPKNIQAFIYDGTNLRWRSLSGFGIQNPLNGNAFISSNRLVFSNGSQNASTLESWTNVDNTNFRLKLGDNLAPTSTLHVVGSVRFNLGSDATGDILYRSSGGDLTRLGIGSTGQFLGINGGLPTWTNTISNLTLSNNSNNTWTDYTVNTTTNTATTIASIPIPNNTVLQIEADIIAVRTGGTAGALGDSGSYKRIYRVTNIAGTVTVNNTSTIVTHESQAGWDVTTQVSGTNLNIRVTGATNNDINWRCIVRIQTGSSF